MAWFKFLFSKCLSSKIRIEHWCIKFSLYSFIIHSTISLAIWYFGKHACDKNHERWCRHCGEAYIWRLTSPLVVILLKLTLKPSSAFSDTCKIILNSAVQADTSKKVSHLVVEMQTLHGHSTQLGRLGLGPFTFLHTKHAHEHFELIILIVIVILTLQQDEHYIIREWEKETLLKR